MTLIIFIRRNIKSEFGRLFLAVDEQMAELKKQQKEELEKLREKHKNQMTELEKRQADEWTRNEKEYLVWETRVKSESSNSFGTIKAYYPNKPQRIALDQDRHCMQIAKVNEGVSTMFANLSDQNAIMFDFLIQQQSAELNALLHYHMIQFKKMCTNQK